MKDYEDKSPDDPALAREIKTLRSHLSNDDAPHGGDCSEAIYACSVLALRARALEGTEP